MFVQGAPLEEMGEFAVLVRFLPCILVFVLRSQFFLARSL